MGRHLRRARKILLWGLGVILIGLPALAAGAFLLTPSGFIAQQIERLAEDRLGRKLVIAGPIERRLYPRIGLSFNDVALENADWAGPEPLFQAARLSADLDLLALISGRTEIAAFRIDQPVLRAALDETGAPNWRLGPALEPPPPSPSVQMGDDPIDPAEAEAEAPPSDAEGVEADLRALSLAVAELSGGRVVIEDRRTASLIEIDEIEATGAYPGYQAPLELSATALVNGRRAKAALRIADLASMEAGKSADLRLSLDGPGATLLFDGGFSALGEEANAVGALTLSLSADRAQTDWLRRSLPAALAPLEAVQASGALVAAPDALDLDLTGAAGFNGEDTRLSVKATAGPGWSRGGDPAAVAATAVNRHLQAGYTGSLGFTAERNLRLEGSYRIAAADVRALTAWAAPGAEPPFLESVDLTGRARISDEEARVTAAGEAGYNGRAAVVSLDASGPLGWRSGAPIATRLDASAPDMFAGDFSGEIQWIDGAPRLEGAGSVETPDWRAFRIWTGGGDLQQDYGAVALSGRLLADAESLEISDGLFQVGAVETEGRALVQWRAPRPRIGVSLSGGPLDLTPFLFSSVPSAEPAPRGETARLSASDGRPVAGEDPPGWSREPFDFGALELFDGRFQLSLEGVKLGALTFERTRVAARLETGRLDLGLEEIRLYGGLATGEASLRGGARGAGARLNATLNGLQTEPFLAALGRTGWIRGAGSLDAVLMSAGESPDAFMRALSGGGSVSIDDGALLALDFAELSLDRKLGALGARQTEPGVTPIDRAAASFQIANGVLTTTDLTVDGPVIRAEAAGQIDIGARRFDLTVTPVGFGDISILGFDRAIGSAYPVRIQGPWARPSIGLDRTREMPAPFDREGPR